MAIQGLKVSEEEVSQMLDLAKLTGVDVSKDPELKAQIAQAVIDFNIERSQGGLDNEGKGFPKYSDTYIDSLDFKAAGKSAGQVDMTLSGDMLGAIDVLDDSGSKVKYGINGETAPRAFAHMTGYKGHPTIKDGPKRAFLGITKADFESEILPKFAKDLSSLEREIAAAQSGSAGAQAAQTSRAAAGVRLSDILADIKTLGDILKLGG